MSANLEKYALILIFVGIVLPFYLAYSQDSADRQNAENLKTNIDNQIREIIGGAVETSPKNIHVSNNIKNINSSGSIITIIYDRAFMPGDKIILDYSSNSRFKSIIIDGYTAGSPGDYSVKSILRADNVLKIMFQKIG